MFAAIGMQAFAERARRELAASGETARQRTIEARDTLTPQEAQIAQLARAGMSTPEIAAQLFLSRTDGRMAPAQKYSPSSRSAPACNSSERCPTAPAPCGCQEGPVTRNPPLKLDVRRSGVVGLGRSPRA